MALPVSSELEKQLKKAVKTGKYVVGRKEVHATLKGSKLLVWSASANISTEILEQCKSFQIPALRFDGDPIALGKLCGIPFKVSVISLKSPGDADIESLSSSRDYTMPKSGLSVSSEPTPIEREEKVEPEKEKEKPKRRAPKSRKKLKDSEKPKE